MTKQRQDYAARNHKALVKALLWSLAAHFLVLGGMQKLPEPAAWSSLPATLVAQFSPKEISAPAIAAPVKKATHPAPVAVTKATRAVPPPPTFAPDSAAVLPIRPEASAIEAAATPATATTSSHSSQAGNSASPAPAPVSAGVDPDGLRSYRVALAVQARRFKRYPAQALASGWEGTAEVRLAIAQGGRPAAAEVVKSSGHEALDRAAQAMIDSAAARAVLPASLQGATFAVTLPVVFNLEDQ